MMKLSAILATLAIALTSVSASNPPCVKKQFYFESFVCVCNSTYCDDIGEFSVPKAAVYDVYTSDQKEHRMDKTQGKVTTKFDKSVPTLTIDMKSRLQDVLGFGGAFTDAAGINIKKLPQAAQEKIMTSYFGPKSIEYTIGRAPIASCDFSTRLYSYADGANDFKLAKFALAEEDFEYRIPFMKEAYKLQNGNIKFFASPWSAPAWMKTNNEMIGNGTLQGVPGGKYFKTWANYFIRYLQEYKKAGIDYWGITAQNEPTDGMLDRFFFNAMGWTPEMQRDFIKLDLGPALKKSEFPDTKLMMLDDNRLWLPKWTQGVLSDKEASKYIHGIGLHWYLDSFAPTSYLEDAHREHPDKFMLATEACMGQYPWEAHVALGDWYRAEKYAHDIIEDLSHWVGGWVDWNLVLDTEGGPNWAKNHVDAPIIIADNNKEFYRQPMFYALGHFSKFIRPGGYRVASQWSTGKYQTSLETVAFKHDKEGFASLIVLNRDNDAVNFQVDIGNGNFIETKIDGRALQTYTWNINQKGKRDL